MNDVNPIISVPDVGEVETFVLNQYIVLCRSHGTVSMHVEGQPTENAGLNVVAPDGVIPPRFSPNARALTLGVQANGQYNGWISVGANGGVSIVTEIAGAQFYTTLTYVTRQ